MNSVLWYPVLIYLWVADVIHDAWLWLRSGFSKGDAK